MAIAIAVVVLILLALLMFIGAIAYVGNRTGVGSGTMIGTDGGTYNIISNPSAVTNNGCTNIEKLKQVYGSSASEVRAQLVPVNFMGKTVMFHKLAAPYLQAVSDDIKASGTTYQFRRLGTFAWRANVNSPDQLSLHSFGIAIDINDDVNCNGCTTTDIPEVVINAFRNHGFRWGGDYRGKKDPMHFEFLGAECP